MLTTRFEAFSRGRTRTRFHTRSAKLLFGDVSQIHRGPFHSLSFPLLGLSRVLLLDNVAATATNEADDCVALGTARADGCEERERESEREREMERKG